MITNCTSFEAESIDNFLKSQLWDCMEDKERIFETCHYQVLATDMMAATLPAKDRAELDMDFLEAVLELYPDCEAVYFVNSGKMFLADQVRNHQVPRESRFIKFAVNARFFNIENTDSMMVDTLGMSTLFLPDIQYHFHDMDPNWVVNHAYSIVSYIFENDNPIKDGETVDGMANGQWISLCSGSVIMRNP